MKKSFTLIELIMVMVLLAIIIAIGVPLLTASTEGWIIATQRDEMLESAKIAIVRMLREMRQIKDSTSILIASQGVFEFINTSDQTLKFSLSSNDLERTLNSTANTLAQNVSSLTFTYYDSAGSTIATPVVSPSETDIKRIQVDIVFSYGLTQLPIRSQVLPRRLR